MIDIRRNVASCYSALDQQHQLVFLVKIGNRLSIEARDTYEVGGADVIDAARLRTFNEAQNRIWAQILRIATADSQRYPDDVFVNILIDQFEMLKLPPEELLRFF